MKIITGHIMTRQLKLPLLILIFAFTACNSDQNDSGPDKRLANTQWRNRLLTFPGNRHYYAFDEAGGGGQFAWPKDSCYVLDSLEVRDGKLISNDKEYAYRLSFGSTLLIVTYPIYYAGDSEDVSYIDVAFERMAYSADTLDICD
ncbi:MAG TPA: hypothetical protein PKX51_20150 [Cyclobacteriaceae bacterium]|nr:hypothetical protein [Cyclobacteriaceae bacterium]